MWPSPNQGLENIAVWMFVSPPLPNSYFESQCLRWWYKKIGLLGGDEVRRGLSSKLGLVCFRRGSRVISHLLPACEGIVRGRQPARASGSLRPCWHLSLGFVASRTVRKNFCCLWTARSLEFCHSSPNGLREVCSTSAKACHMTQPKVQCSARLPESGWKGSAYL